MGERVADSDYRQRAELYLSLSRAFLPPRTEAYRRALLTTLPAELATLLASDDNAKQCSTKLGQAARTLGTEHELLVGYSALFLTPPYRVPLNASLHLDGAIISTTTQAIRACYRRYGLDRAEGFKDLHDHLAVELEFIAYLWSKADEDKAGKEEGLRDRLAEISHFLDHYLAPWLPGLMQKLLAAQHDQPAAAFYRALAEITHQCVEVDLGLLRRMDVRHEPEAPPPAVDHRAIRSKAREKLADQQLNAEQEVCCSLCQASFLLHGKRAAVYQRLKALEAPTDHLRLCPSCRTGGEAQQTLPSLGDARRAPSNTSMRTARSSRARRNPHWESTNWHKDSDTQ